jgi:hypothetical protein
METETDMEVTEVDDNFNTEMGLRPERGATDPRQRELELLGKREREGREMEERLHNLGSILCKKCRDFVAVSTVRCPRCDAYNVHNDQDSWEDKRKNVMTAVKQILAPQTSRFEASVEASQNIYLNGPNEVPVPVGFSTIVSENLRARGGQTPRPPKSIQWMREWDRRLSRWKKLAGFEGEDTVLRWFNEHPDALSEIAACNYTVEEFKRDIPKIQQVVNDKRAGIVTPVITMSYQQRIDTLARANAPQVRSSQRGGNTVPKFEDPHFTSAFALMSEYGRAQMADAKRLAEQRSEATTTWEASTTSSSSLRGSSATRKGSAHVSHSYRDDRLTTSVPSYDPVLGRSDERVEIIETLDPDLFVDYCEHCGDYDDARIRWVDMSKDGGNSNIYVEGKACANAKTCKTYQISKNEDNFAGCCFRCSQNFLCYSCAWERSYDRTTVPPRWKRASLANGPAWTGQIRKDECWFWKELGPGACYNGRFCGYKHSRDSGIRRVELRERSYRGSME